MVNITALSLLSRGKKTRNLLNRSSGGVQSRSQPLPKLERRTVQPVAKSDKTYPGASVRVTPFLPTFTNRCLFLEVRKNAYNVVLMNMLS